MACTVIPAPISRAATGHRACLSRAPSVEGVEAGAGPSTRLGARAGRVPTYACPVIPKAVGPTPFPSAVIAATLSLAPSVRVAAEGVTAEGLAKAMEKVILVVAPVAKEPRIRPAAPSGLATAVVPGQEVTVEGVAMGAPPMPSTAVTGVGPGLPGRA